MGRANLMAVLPNTLTADHEQHQATVDCFRLAFGEPDCPEPVDELGLSVTILQLRNEGIR